MARGSLGGAFLGLGICGATANGIGIKPVLLEIGLISSQACKQFGFWEPFFTLKRQIFFWHDTIRAELNTIGTWRIPVTLNLALLT